MQKTRIEYKIGFSDGEIVSYSKDKAGMLKVVFKSWNEKHLDILFKDTIRFLDNNMYSISDLVRVDESQFLLDAVNMMYTEIPDSNPYKHFQFLNIDGDPSLEIIATDLNINES